MDLTTPLFHQNSAVAVVVGILSGPVVTLLLAWFAGSRLTARWGLWQKRRELAHSAAAEFHRFYGEHFSIWKLWNHLLDSELDQTDQKWLDRRWDLLTRAAKTEAGFEALLVKLVSERHMKPSDVRVLGCFRQAYQQLRKHIRRNARLNWSSSDHSRYLAFKRLSVAVGAMIAMADLGKAPSLDEASSALELITSNDWEEIWWQHAYGQAEHQKSNTEVANR